MVDLHLVSWNRPKMTELVIKTIHRNTPRNDFRLVVLDNKSDDDTREMLMNMHENGFIDEMIFEPENVGLERARQLLCFNVDLEFDINTEFFVDIDNDCLPPEGWLDAQVDLMHKYEDYAAIAQRTQVMIGTGNIFETSDAIGMDITDFPHPGGSFRMMRTSAVDAVGGWDRESSGRGSEERYICGKLHEAGYGTAFATNIKTLHLFGLGDTDNWGYPKGWKPEDTGHSPDVWHPIFASGDDFEDIARFAGEELAHDYCNN
jgi:GT2 family glycosyltransferase